MDTRLFLIDLADKWTQKYPSQKDRVARGLALALAGKVAPRSLDSWRVVGSKAGVEYTVKITCGYPSCDCPDASRRETRCKHIWGCALMTRLASELEAVLATPAPKKAPAAPPKAPLSKGLSDLCARLHAENNARLLASQEAPHTLS
jgi:hypothetical protein